MDLEVVGRHALLFDDDATAAFVNSSDALVDWNSLLIDRYDVRHLLSGPPPPRRRRQMHSPPSVSSIVSELDQERYLDLPPPSEEQAGHTMMTLPVTNLLKLLYPDLVRIDEFLIKGSSKADDFKVSRLPLTAESLDSRGLYIYDDGFWFVMWFGRMLSPDIAMNLLGQTTDLSKVIEKYPSG